MAGSILDDLGQEVTGIVAPVSLCMLLTVLLVRLLNPEGTASSNAIAIAQTFYKEKVSPGSVALHLSRHLSLHARQPSYTSFIGGRLVHDKVGRSSDKRPHFCGYCGGDDFCPLPPLQVWGKLPTVVFASTKCRTIGCRTKLTYSKPSCSVNE